LGRRDGAYPSIGRFCGGNVGHRRQLETKKRHKKEGGDEIENTCMIIQVQKKKRHVDRWSTAPLQATITLVGGGGKGVQGGSQKRCKGPKSVSDKIKNSPSYQMRLPIGREGEEKEKRETR